MERHKWEGGRVQDSARVVVMAASQHNTTGCWKVTGTLLDTTGAEWHEQEGGGVQNGTRVVVPTQYDREVMGVHEQEGGRVQNSTRVVVLARYDREVTGVLGCDQGCWKAMRVCLM